MEMVSLRRTQQAHNRRDATARAHEINARPLRRRRREWTSGPACSSSDASQRARGRTIIRPLHCRRTPTRGRGSPRGKRLLKTATNRYRRVNSYYREAPAQDALVPRNKERVKKKRDTWPKAVSKEPHIDVLKGKTKKTKSKSSGHRLYHVAL